jgi:hypothetical protein
MKNLVKKTVEFLSGAKVYSNHTAIKGDKSGGVADISSVYKHFRANLPGQGTVTH